ncbi:MAG: hypothetical protein DWP94_03420 [Flavobacterium sp.]|nr:MAG: hypothetical protein DWP94_03420 [Flavobacterium sp.]
MKIEIKKARELVRTIKIWQSSSGLSCSKYELMTYEKYLHRKEYLLMNEKFDLAPYKWYDPNRVFDYYHYHRKGNSWMFNLLLGSKSIIIQLIKWIVGKFLS